MTNKVVYEWALEFVDEHGDIIDIEHSDTLDEYFLRDYVTKPEQYARVDLVLIRDEGNDYDGLCDRNWCYAKGLKLPESFSDSYQHPLPNMKVPVRIKRKWGTTAKLLKKMESYS